MTTLRIEKVVYGGDGLGRAEGRVVFVPFTIEGETVEVQITSEHKNFARGQLLHVLEPCGERRTPPCPYFGSCGGCQLQHMSYEEQIHVKEKQLREFFSPVLPLVPAPQTLYYRKKISPRHEGGLIGFTGLDNQSFVPVDRCLLFSDQPLQEIPHFKDEGPFLIKNLSIQVSQEAFCQNFPEQSLHLYLYIESLIAEEKPSLMTDLYCGVGVTSLLSAAYADHVYGVELSREAVRLARLNASHNGLTNVSFTAHKAEQAQMKGSLILLDPPRRGAEACVLEKIVSSEAHTVIYTSCNPATLARDLKRLEGFTLISCKPFDMFPQTAHVEIVALLRRL